MSGLMIEKTSKLEIGNIIKKDLNPNIIVIILLRAKVLKIA